jgi:hypothetical protein
MAINVTNDFVLGKDFDLLPDPPLKLDTGEWIYGIRVISDRMKQAFIVKQAENSLPEGSKWRQKANQLIYRVDSVGVTGAGDDQATRVKIRLDTDLTSLLLVEVQEFLNTYLPL